MYLDPGSAGLFVQALFAAIAATFAFFRRAREYAGLLLARMTTRLRGRRRRSPDT